MLSWHSMLDGGHGVVDMRLGGFCSSGMYRLALCLLFFGLIGFALVV